MPGILISVSAVRISPDMSVARAYLSVFPSERSEEIIKNVNANMKSIRFELGTSGVDYCQQSCLLLSTDRRAIVNRAVDSSQHPMFFLRKKNSLYSNT